jgi:PKD repeat protein
VLSTVQHAYRRPGTYTVTLRVAGERGAVLTHRQDVRVR